jgi:hypothetical protein
MQQKKKKCIALSFVYAFKIVHVWELNKLQQRQSVYVEKEPNSAWDIHTRIILSLFRIWNNNSQMQHFSDTLSNELKC